MKQQHAGDGINFYKGYRQLVNSEKNDKSKRRAKLIVPIVLIAAVLGGISVNFLLKNSQKAEEAAGVESEIASMQADYDEAVAIEARLTDAEARYAQLLSGRFMFSIYPPLSQDIFEQVQACAGNIFNISSYSYDETSSTLTLDASADSVNEVPKFVYRLRETGLFENVHYTGYTSEQEQTYFCTVSCMLGVDDVFSYDEEDLSQD